MALTVTASAAQDAPLPVASALSVSGSNPSATLEEIVVTSRKIEESLQDAPIAITALTQATIELRNLQDVRDLATSTPNLILQTVGRGGAASAPAVYVRGIGQADNALNADPGVGIYVDGVYMPRNVGNVLSLGDVQRIEVLRGPQGTLFGKNTIGGALSLILNSPTDHFDASAEASAGSFERIALRGMLNVPLSGNLFMRLSAYGNRQDGYVNLVNYPGRELGDDHSAGANARLRWLPTDALTIDLSVDGSRVDNSGTPNVLRAVFPAALVPTLYNVNFSGDPACLTAAGQATNRACFGPVQIPTDIERSNQVLYGRNGPIGPLSENKQWGANLTAALDLPFGTATSISSYRSNRSGSRENLGYFEALIFEGTRGPDLSTQFSQEIRLNGLAIHDRLKWLLGGFYANEDVESKIDALSPLALILPFNSYPVFSFTDFTGTTKNTAFFGQGTFDITPRVHLTGGMRWTKEEKDAIVKITPSAYPTLHGNMSTQKVTPLVSLTFDLSDDINAYVSYSEGFRSGGFPTRISGQVSAVPHYGEELAKAYEIGLKSEFFDRRARLNIAAFSTDYNDIQLAGTTFAATPPLATIINAGKARIRGFEGEFTALVSDTLSLDASVGYIDSKLLALDPTANESGVSLTTANKLPFSPEWKVAGGATVTLPFSSGAAVIVRADVNYVAQMFFSIANFPNAQQDALTLFNASVAYRFSNDKTEIVLGARNLTDETYFTNGLEDRRTNGLAYQTLAPPRTVFLTGRWKY